MLETEVCLASCTKQKVATDYQYQGGNPLHLSAIATGVELPALLQLIHKCCLAIQVVQFVMHTRQSGGGRSVKSGC